MSSTNGGPSVTTTPNVVVQAVPAGSSSVPIDPSSVAITGGTIGNVPVKPTNTLGVIGDSITGFCAVDTSNGANYDLRGYLTHAMAISGGRVMPGSVFGGSGYTAAQVLAQLPTFLSTCNDAAVVFFAGANDIVAADASLQTPAQVFATLQSGYALIRAAGKVPIGATVLPRTDAVSAAQVALRNGINALLRAEQAAGRLLLADWTNVYQDSAGAISTTISSDGIHPYQGAEMMGQVLWSTVQPIFPTANLSLLANFGDASNLLTGGLMAGTGGTVTGGASGSVATGWLLNATGNATSCVGSKVASTDTDDLNEWQQIVFTANGVGNGTFSLQQQITLAVGQRARISAQVEIDVTDAASLVGYGVRITSFPSSTSGTCIGGADATKPFRATPATRRRTSVTPPFTIPVGSTSVFCYFDGVVAANKSVTFRIRRAKCAVA